jgi:hypothetical protein
VLAAPEPLNPGGEGDSWLEQASKQLAADLPPVTPGAAS